MPPPYGLNDGDIVESISWANLFGQKILMTAHWKIQGSAVPDGPAYLQALNTDLTTGSHLFNVARSLQTNSLSYEYVTSQVVWPTRWAPEQKIWTQQGAYDAASSPQNLAWSFQRHVAQAGRGYQGRIQLCGYPQSWNQSGYVVFEIGALANVALFEACISLTFSVTGYVTAVVPVLRSRAGTGSTTRNVTKGTRTTTVRTMHRRTVGLGI